MGYSKAYYEANRDKIRAYYMANKDHLEAKRKLRRAKNPEATKAAARRYRIKNMERIREYKHRPETLEARKKHQKSRDPVANRAIHLRREFGITLHEYNALFELQGGVCAICKKPSTGQSLAVDHDHVTGEIRGLLCSKHNQALGAFNDSRNVLSRAIEYLDFPPSRSLGAPLFMQIHRSARSAEAPLKAI